MRKRRVAKLIVLMPIAASALLLFVAQTRSDPAAGERRVRAVAEKPSASDSGVLARNLTWPFAERSSKDVSELKRKLKVDLAKNAGGKPTEAAIPKGKPADDFVCQKQYEAAKGDRRALYLLIAQHLVLADKLISQDSADVRRSGLGIARQAAFCASERLKDHEVAIGITESYLLPRFELADERHWKRLSRETLAKNITGFYFSAKKYDGMADAAQLWMRMAPNRNSVDAARARLAQALHSQGKAEEAIAVLEQISEETGMAGVKRFIPELRKSVDANNVMK